ncbi:hypothetical protein [Actinomadura sp. 9N407]|uniref:hypothetical protein n=1 Tax=Actinomadura sp. 9N407 TaxID=3375154 RepID=UPI0037AD4B25
MNATSFSALFGSPSAAPFDVDWDMVESWLGVPLPSDYKAVVSAYGPLDIGEFIWLHAPCVQPGRFDYATWLKGTHRDCRIASRDVPPYEPPAFHPAPGGLLAWGTTRACSELFWDTSASDDPDQWPVVVFHRDAMNRGTSPWHIYESSLLETLAAVVGTGLPLPGGDTLGPLPATAERTAFLPDAAPWTPPVPEPEIVPEAQRRAALTNGTGLDAIRLLAPPPEEPYLGDGTWEQLFDALGTRLPTEYVTLIELYGAGCMSNWLRFVPPTRHGTSGLAQYVESSLGDYRDLRAEFPEEQPLPVWPEPGGFLPFANSIDGDQLGWLVQGDPDSWPLIVYPRHSDQGPPLPGGLVDTLLDWLRGRLTTPDFPVLDEDDDPLDFIGFDSWNAEAYD